MTPASALEINAILRSDSHAFAQKCFAELHSGKDWKPNWHLEAISHALEDVTRGATKRLIINMPPRSLKSMLVAVAFPAYLLGKNPATKIICASYSQDLAEKHAADFRRVIEAEWYADTFGRLALTKSTGSEVATSAGGFRLATSVGGTLTGRGGDVIILDDPLNAAEASSKTARDRTNDWFSQTLVSRLDDQQSGAIVLVMQRLHDEDLTGYLLERGGDWKLLSLPAINSEDRTIPLLNGRSFFWRMGEPLHASRDSLKQLEALKHQVGSYVFNAQYLQKPVPDTGNMLKREWLREYDIAPVTAEGDEIVQSWDTAMKVTNKNDYSVCLTFLVRNKNQYFLTDVLRERLEFPDLLRKADQQARQHQANAVLIEDAMAGTGLVSCARKAGLQGIIPIKPNGDKATRMYLATPMLESGSLLLPKNAPWLLEFLREYLRFPTSAHDDQMDALSQFLLWQWDRGSGSFEADFGHDAAYHERVKSLTPDELLCFRGPFYRRR